MGNLRNASKRSAEYSEKHFFQIGLVCVVVVPISAFVERLVAEPSFDTLGIRLLASLSGVPLVFYKQIPRKWLRHFDLYWILAVSYVLPFSFGLMLLLNASYAENPNSVSSIWNYQYLIALFFFVQLIHHGPLAVLIWIVSSSLGLCSLFVIESPNWDAINHSVLLPLPIYITAVAIGSLMNRNVAMVQTEKLRAASAIGSNLAHELRTPLASIRIIAQGATNLFPLLTDAYRKAKAAGIEVGVLRDSQVQALTESLGTIQNEVAYSNTIIDMLLINTADKSLSDVELQRFSMRECVEEAVSRYPFNNQRERELISIEVEEGLELSAPRLLIVHVLFNLIKNSLLYVQKSSDGKISIIGRRGLSGVELVVHDTGRGIPSQIRQHIFERFYTTTRTGQGAGIGLSFCKMVMDAIGGSIACDSIEGEFCTFTLTFKETLEQ